MPSPGSIKILDFIREVIPENFECRTKVLNGKYFDTAQERKRSITLISQKGSWDFPKNNIEVKKRLNNLKIGTYKIF